VDLLPILPSDALNFDHKGRPRMSLIRPSLRQILCATTVSALTAGLVVAMPTAADAATTTQCTPSTCTMSFSIEGSAQTFTVPDGVSALTVAVRGAQGGASRFGAGGMGAAVSGVLPVSPHETLSVLVGATGSIQGGRTVGGGGASFGQYYASGGGGSFLFDSDGNLLVAAAGGGGGAFLQQIGGAGAAIGATGGTSGGLGYTGERNPTGGTPTAAGAGGGNSIGTGSPGDGPAVSGSPGTGGDGTRNGDPYYPGSGGGGGYFGGGGGGYGQGAAGGSSYAAASLTSLSSTTGTNSGNGVVTLGWARQSASIGLAATPSDGITLGESVTLSASVAGDFGTPTGTVEFDLSGTPISDCGSVAVTAGTASCTTTSLPAGSDNVAANYSGDFVYAPAASTALSYHVAYPALEITTSTLADGTVDAPFEQSLTATGGLAPYTWSVTTGDLPAGLTLDPSGTISGTPTQAGDMTPIGLTVTDAQGTPYAASANLTITVGKATQTVAFTSAVPAAKVGDSTTVSASGGASGNPATFSVDASTTNAACSISGTTVSFDHFGTCVLDADQAGNADYYSAQTTQQQIPVGPAAQAVNFTSPAPDSATVGGSAAVTVAGGASDNPVTLAVDASTTNATCSVSATTVSFDHTGTCVLAADQAGTADYTAAPTAYQSFVVGKAAQAITFTSAAPTADGAGDTYAVATDGGASGNGVNLSIDPGASSVCSVDGNTVTFQHAGTCTVNADQAGNDDYEAAPTAQQSVAVNKIAQTITFTSAPPRNAAAVVGANYTVTATGGATDNPVIFSVDAATTNGACTTTGPTVTFLHPGNCMLAADQNGTDDYTAASPATMQVPVSAAATTTEVSVSSSAITAHVGVVRPGAGTPTGAVRFLVGGVQVGKANLVGGVATLTRAVSTGATRTVAVVYGGSADFTGSSASVDRKDPSITAKVTSAHAATKYGWHHSPVTVSFLCVTHGAPLSAPCPSPVTLRHNGAGQSITRTITATNGGISTVAFRGINIDRVAPSVRVGGVRNGVSYGVGVVPTAQCVGKDRVSGIASCTVLRRTHGTRVTVTAVATDKAGNVRRASVNYRLLPIYLDGARYRNGAFDVRAGHTYTLVVTGSSAQPTYYNAAVYPRQPGPNGPALHHCGFHRWALGVTMTPNLHSYRYWNLGVKIGHTMHRIKIRVS
jgi:hypothetical protein